MSEQQQECRIGLLLSAQSCLEGSTVHGLSRSVDDSRPTYLRVAWLIAVLLSIAICGARIAELGQRFVSGNIAASVRENAIKFEFPDVYACNENPISGSFPGKLDSASTQLLTKYRHMAKTHSASLLEGFNLSYIALYPALLINTLPFQFLSDKLAHRAYQTAIESSLTFSQISPTTFHHPRYINCISFNMSQSERLLSSNRESGVFLTLFLDALLPTVKDIDIVSYFGGNSSLSLVDLDWDMGIDYWRPTGFHVFLTPRGEYPSELGAHFTVGPGQQARVQVRMEETVYNAGDFPHVCSTSGTDNADEVPDFVDFVNPYSGAKEQFKYSQTSCFYQELARLFHRYFNCSAARMPLVWEYRQLPHCLNITGGHTSAIGANFHRSRTDRIFEAVQKCEKLRRCSSRSYSYEYSSSGLTPDHIAQQFLTASIRANYQALTSAGHQLPGIEHLLKLNTSNSRDMDQFRRSIVQIMVSAGSSQSRQVELSLDYNVNSLIADVGGMLGLFLGMSLLSMLELVDLVLNCVRHACRSRSRVTGDTRKSSPARQPEQCIPSSSEV